MQKQIGRHNRGRRLLHRIAHPVGGQMPENADKKTATSVIGTTMVNAFTYSAVTNIGDRRSGEE